MMKKTFVLGLLFILINPVLAQEDWSCASEPYPVASKVSGFFNTVTGANFFATRAVEKIIKSNLQKETGATFDVTMKPFNATDLVTGKFQSLIFNAPELNLGGIYVHNFTGATQCEYNRIEFKKNEIPKIYEDFILNFSAAVTNADLQKTLASEDFQKYVKSLNFKVGNFEMLRVEKPQIQIINNKLRYSFRVIAPVFLSTISQEISCDMDLKVTDGKLMLANANVNNLGAISTDIINPIINKINPFKISLEKSLKIPSYLQVKDVNIINNSINFTGVFVAPKNVNT